METESRRLPTVRVFAPEQWGEVDRFISLHSETYKLADRDKRAVGGVCSHFEKAIAFQERVLSLRPGLEVDRDELNKRGYTPASNAREMSSMFEAAVTELYSSLDCAVKVIRAIYAKSSRRFPDSTRKLFANFEKVTGTFLTLSRRCSEPPPGTPELMRLRDELTHLSTGLCNLDDKTGVVNYMHVGMKTNGNAYIIEDAFVWLADYVVKIDTFLGALFRFLNSTLKATPTPQVCGFVEGRILMRYLNPTEPLTFDNGQCLAYQWFELPENPTCPFVEACGAYKKRFPRNVTSADKVNSQ
jgi:hypothetical protein